MEPGIYYDLPDADYRELPYPSNSGLRHLKRPGGEAIYKAYILDRVGEKKRSQALEDGKAFHMAILEPGRFQEEYIKQPTGIDLRYKKGKEWLASQGGKKPIKAVQWASIEGMANSIWKHPKMPHILRGGKSEVSAVFKGHMGTIGKLRADIVCESEFYDSVDIVDLKTTQNANPKDFYNSVEKFDYYRQAAYYIDGFEALGVPVGAFYFFCVEKYPPYLCSIVQLSKGMVEKGRQEYRKDIETLQRCLRTEHWSGLSTEIATLDEEGTVSYE